MSAAARSDGADARILGIDPGMASTGFAIVDRIGTRLVPVWYDCLRTSAQEAAHVRLTSIAAACRDVVERFAPDDLAIEDLFFGADARVALAVGQARGACIVTCAQAGLDVFDYAPAAVKSAVTGYGRADKQQVQRMVQQILGMSEMPRPDHAADAFAVAICHAGAVRFARRR